MTDYRIDDLAQTAGVAVRNIRAYQDRGLLPPPRREGRVGLYSEDHLARLRLITSLLERGYSLQNIAELVGAFEKGHDLGELLGLGLAVAGPFSDEVAGSITFPELVAMFTPATGALDAEIVRQAVELHLVEIDGDRLRVPSPRLLHAGAELARAGVPLPALLDELRNLRHDLDQVARRFVELVSTHLFHDASGELPPADEVPHLAEVVQRIRPLAQMVVDAELARGLEYHSRRQLGELLAGLLAGSA
ncbi:MAG: MerR family transcriptional regulator [Acidimicrobiia bacterium]